ncbi:unnamed protein product [Gulo gulo]|uniref:Small nuclear ribonucleoprotein Sm D2 n=1 Tax=Gulo gulo TaxID=48420 RepID=A0A9X9M0Z8_GULGU|nr:unnamed protein product [Gulo gulo]
MKATERHCSMVVENVREMWTKVLKSITGKKKSKPVSKDHISKMFLHRDWVIMVLSTHSLLASRGPFLTIRIPPLILQRPVLCNGNNKVLCFSKK